MCHYCGAELAKSKEDRKTEDNVNSLKLGKQDPILSCKCCEDRHERESLPGTVLQSPYATPMISATTSLSSSDCSTSGFGVRSVDTNMYDRSNQEGVVNSYQENHNHRPNCQFQNISFESSINERDRSHAHPGSAIDNGRYVGGDVNEAIPISSGLIEKDISTESSSGSDDEDIENSHPFEDVVDTQIWEPPEPEDSVDDMEGGVAFNDDDECGDGTEWGKPSSLCTSSGGEGTWCYKLKEEKERAMEEVVNGKFKALVCQLLKSVGIAPYGEDVASWVDIVTSLSWEAASFLKPDAVVSNSMDSDGYVKVKCIATGVRSQSQLVKGLVFKKHAAHKHMPTKYKNPKLLLVRGVLGQSSSGLSSFASMEQEKDYLKSVIETLDLCHPNVVLVEKSVSRDIQESILDKGMTLVFDMKLHRLERVARCTGSSILSADTIRSQNLKQCASFYIEKFVEEHAGSSEGGKKPSKSLMFIEGCPTRLGCTILLKGAPTDELKRVKCVVQCAVIMAYHLILETSFLVDQRAMFSTIPFSGVTNLMSSEVVNALSNGQHFFSLGSDNSNAPCLVGATAETKSPKVDIPISNGFHDHNSASDTELPKVEIPVSDGFHGVYSYNSDLELEGNSLSYEPYNPAIQSGFSSPSASPKKVVGENFPLASSSYQSLSSYFGFNGRGSNDQIAKAISPSTSPTALDYNVAEDKSCSDDEKLLNVEESQSSCESSEAAEEVKNDSDSDEGKSKNDSDSDEGKSKNDINAVLDSQSILVLMSRRNALRGTVCEQRHFSHIVFYKNFDVPLGKFLLDNLLNQKTQCNICGELPEAHLYYYAHHKKQLTIKVKHLAPEKSLHGEAEGKIWMWGRCGKCKDGNGISKSTKRVLISTTARGLSFGKFLELGFSNHSSCQLSSCGHLLHRDFLYFFGFGPVVAMFRYSPVSTYAVSLPPWKLQLSNLIKQDLLMKEIKDVYMKGILLFSEIESSLKKIKSQFEGLTLNLRGSLKEFTDIEDMLKQERSEFEGNIKKAASKNGSSDQVVYRLLGLNRLLWELLLESCIWDQRMHSLLLPDARMLGSSTAKKLVQDQKKSGMNGIGEERNVGPEVSLERSDLRFDGGANINVKLAMSTDVDDFPKQDILVEDRAEESKQGKIFGASIVAERTEILIEGDLSPKGSASYDSHMLPNGSNHYPDDRRSENASDLLKNTSESFLLHNLENSNEWFWAPFADIRGIDMRGLQKLYFQKFQPLGRYTMEYLPTAYQLITEEGQRLHIPLGTDSYIVSDYDGELSSVIACALAVLKEGDDALKSIESFHSLTRIPTDISSHWSSHGSLDSDSVNLIASLSFDESRFSSFDGMNLLESLVPPGTVNPIVPLGFDKSLGKYRYTVICPYANQFRDLRNWCCPSELDYIASLSRCRNWDAKGGKSKSFFAKTLDERLIIKEIKKTEFESFMKFAGNYFEYIKESFEVGSQTCLAKVLGIYQVIVRQTKSGKETRHDLMVMESLTFNRNITRQYDLKGALYARYNMTANDPSDVLLDQNFVNDMNSSPLYVSNRAKHLLERAIWNDTTFLRSLNVVDYSLLVVVDTQRRELVCGIIDYLRQYTWDKQLETWVKSSLVPRNLLPTVIPAIEYKRRFRKFMGTHFLSIPDNWCSEKSSDHCDICGVGE